jgi:hypothetical protein
MGHRLRRRLAMAAVAVALVAGVGVVGGPAPFVAADLPPLEHDPDDVRDTADEVMSRPEFAEQEGLLQRIVNWIRDRLDDLFGDRQQPDPGAPRLNPGGLGTLLGWILVVALLVVAVFLVVRFVRFGRLGRRRKAEPDIDVEEEAPTNPLDEITGDADTLEAAGRWREAMVVRYRDLVGDLVDARILEPIPGRTSGEYRDELAGSVPAVADPFDDATELFERAWYGNLPTGVEESRRFQDAAGSVLAGTRR